MSDIATLLAGDVSIAWYEGVALVREVADRLLTTAGEHAVPELHQIRLTAEGRVEIIGVTRTDEPVRRMGQLLQALLAHSEIPVQLRLFLSQATAPTPTFSSIREYSEALAFFERPDRSAVLQQLAARAAAASGPVVSDSAITLDSLAPLPAEPEAEESKPKPVVRSQPRSWRFAATALVVMLAAIGGAWYAWNRGWGPRNQGDVSQLANRASDAIGDAVISGASAITEGLGLGRIVPASQVTQPLVPPPPPPAPEPKPREVRPEPPPVPPLLAFDLDPVPGPDQASAPMPPERRPPDLRIPDPPPDDLTVYSPESADVIPPVATRPQIARELPAGFDRTRLGQIELLIAKDGSVESAKLLTMPRDVNEGLWVSVAKAWTFQPALKEGVPVRYRKTIWVARP